MDPATRLPHPRGGADRLAGLALVGHDRRPRHGAADALRDGRGLVDVEVGTPGRLEVAGAALAQGLEELVELGQGRRPARHLTAVRADVADRPGGREPDRTGVERLAHDRPHRRHLGDGGLPLGRVVTHDVVAERGVAEQRRDVELERQRIERVEVLGEGLEGPRDALREGVERHALDVLQHPHDGVAVGRTRRCEPEAAVAHDHGGDAVPRRGGEVGVPQDLGVVVGVRVDEAGRQHEAVEVDHRGAVEGLGLPAHRLDQPVGHHDGRVARRCGGAVDHPCAPQHDPVHLCLLRGASCVN